MTADQPLFRFNPGAYDEKRSLKPSQEICEVCSKPCVWTYTGNIYSLTTPTVCARCIADGELEAFLRDDFFTLHDIEIDGADPSLEQELLKRTPGVACFNPFSWPVLDGIPLAFMGYGNEKDLIALPEVRAAMSEAFEGFGLKCAPSPYALIFKEVDGPRYRVVIDHD
ncbi:CbrC family protein [Sphingomonas sp. DBB INV C78]|uniref:CbrC family protein n=1 Tax=Sphingomonas sp. DBB INV C78 TaxID=3349434 RepID=UPI0036D39F7D